MKRFCTKCGKEIVSGGAFCPACGQPVSNKRTQSEAEFTATVNQTGNLGRKLSPKAKKMAIIGAAVSIAILLIFVLFPKGGYETPFENMEKAFNNQDVKAFRKAFIPPYTSKLSDEDLMGELKDRGKTKIKIVSQYDQKLEDLSQYIDTKSEVFEGGIMGSINKFCIVNMEMQTTYEGETSTDEISGIVVVEIDGKWYIVPNEAYL